MMNKSSSSSDNGAKEQEVYESLEKFVYFLANNHCDPDMPGSMEYDELVGELFLELAKGLKHYKGMPKDSMIRLLKKMLDNRIGELRYKYYLTHRGLGRLSLSLSVSADDDANPLGDDYPDLEETIADGYDTPALIESQERVTLTRSRLSADAQTVFDAIIYGNTRLSIVTAASAMRSSAIFKNPCNKVRPWHLADALFMDEQAVRKCLDEIKSTYTDVLADKE